MKRVEQITRTNPEIVPLINTLITSFYLGTPAWHIARATVLINYTELRS